MSCENLILPIMPIKKHLRWPLNRGTILFIIRRLCLFLHLVVRRGYSIFSKCNSFWTRHVVLWIVRMNLLHRSILKNIITHWRPWNIWRHHSLLFVLILFLDLFESRVVIDRVEGICHLSICNMHSCVTLGACVLSLYVISLHVVPSLNWLTHSSVIWQKWKLLLRVDIILIWLIQLFSVFWLKKLLVLLNQCLTDAKIVPITFEYVGLIYTTITSSESSWWWHHCSVRSNALSFAANIWVVH